jgi:3-deoxy-D-manno-octulosonic-acid transferase
MGDVGGGSVSDGKPGAGPALKVWRALGAVAAPFVALWLRRRVGRGKEDAARLAERIGITAAVRPAGPLVWLHAASVGEAISILPLVERLLAADARLHVLVTTGTVTSAGLMSQRLPARALHQFVPVDVPEAVTRFLDHWRPDLALWVESELWPGLLAAIRERGVPLVLLNGRMSLRSFGRWRLAPIVIRPMLACFDRILAQSAADAERFAALGGAPVVAAGNLKLAAPPLEHDPAELARLRGLIGVRPYWLAASTHAGEEAAAVEAHIALAAEAADILTLVVPRHPDRGPALAAEFRDRGLYVALRSAGDPLEDETEIYIADTMGELGLWYALAEVVFVGGTLVHRGGQNPLEPARLDCAIIVGPDLRNFAEIAASLRAGDALRQIGRAEELAPAVADLLLHDRARAKALAAHARAVAGGEDGALDRVLAELAPYLARL